MVGHGRYILDADGEPQPCDDDTVWHHWMNTANRRVAEDFVPSGGGHTIRVTTVFIGLDQRPALIDPVQAAHGRAMLWETRVYGGDHLDGMIERYTWRADALAGHQTMCRRVRELLRKS